MFCYSIMDLLLSHFLDTPTGPAIGIPARVPPPSPSSHHPQNLVMGPQRMKDAASVCSNENFSSIPNIASMATGVLTNHQGYSDSGLAPLQLEEDLPIPDFNHLPSSLEEDDNNHHTTNPLRSAIFQTILNSYPQLSRKMQRSHYVAKKFQEAPSNRSDCLYQASRASKLSDDITVDNLVSDFMDEEFDSGYYSFSDNASINSSGSISPNSSAMDQLQQKFLEDSSLKNECSNFDDLCVYESIMDSCSKPCDVLEARNVSSAVIVSSAVKFKHSKHQCPVCGKTYRGNTNLNYHMATHTGIRPHKCSICGKAFTQKSTLRTHFQIHTGEKHKKCRTCTRAFADYSTCMKHERTHSGEKPYACPECGKCFAQSGNMLRHRQTHRKN